MKKSLISSLFLSFFVAFFAISFVSAQTNTDNEVTAEAEAEVVVSADNSGGASDDIMVELDMEEQLEGVTVAEVEKVPSGFGLWLRDWRERIVVALTLDSVKKAEKQLVYAEERMKIAEKILEESTDPNAQQKAEKMIAVAQKHIDKIQARKDKWVEKTNERVERLKNNLATHQLRKDKVLERIEENLPEEAKERFGEMRERILEKGRDFLGDLDDGELTERTFEHLRNVRDRIEDHVGAVKQFNQSRREILQNSDLSAEQKREEVRLLNDERKTRLEEIRLEFKESDKDLFRRVEEGDENASRRLELIRDAKKVIDERKDVLMERAENLSEIRKEGLDEEKLKERLEQMRKDNQAKEAELMKKREAIIRAEVELFVERQKTQMETRRMRDGEQTEEMNDVR